MPINIESKFSFGKYQGQKFKDIVSTDLGYIKYLMERDACTFSYKAKTLYHLYRIMAGETICASEFGTLRREGFAAFIATAAVKYGERGPSDDGYVRSMTNWLMDFRDKFKPTASDEEFTALFKDSHPRYLLIMAITSVSEGIPTQKEWNMINKTKDVDHIKVINDLVTKLSRYRTSEKMQREYSEWGSW